MAALDVLSSVGDDFIQSQTGLSNVLSALDQLAHERQAFMAAVRQLQPGYRGVPDGGCASRHHRANTLVATDPQDRAQCESPSWSSRRAKFVL